MRCVCGKDTIILHSAGVGDTQQHEFTTEVDSMLESAKKQAVAMKTAQLCQIATPGEFIAEVDSILESTDKPAIARRPATTNHVLEEWSPPKFC